MRATTAAAAFRAAAILLAIAAFYVMSRPDTVYYLALLGPGETIQKTTNYLDLGFLTFGALMVLHTLTVVLGLIWLVALVWVTAAGRRGGRALAGLGVVLGVCALAAPLSSLPQPVAAFVIAGLLIASVAAHLLADRFTPRPDAADDPRPDGS